MLFMHLLRPDNTAAFDHSTVRFYRLLFLELFIRASFSAILFALPEVVLVDLFAVMTGGACCKHGASPWLLLDSNIQTRCLLPQATPLGRRLNEKKKVP
jgi:hypothetical protein